MLVYAGPASGFAVLSQAAELLNNSETIHQQLHMSEFDSSEKEVLVDSGIRLPPKEVADKYIEGQWIYMELLLVHKALTLHLQRTSGTPFSQYFIALHFKIERN